MTTRGVFGGGFTSVYSDVLDYITIASTGNATEFGNLTQARSSLAACADTTRGVFGGGLGVSFSSILDYITIASTGNATNFGNLTQVRPNLAACADATRGVFGGGHSGTHTYSDVLDYITIANTGNATNFGDLVQARSNLAACADATRGVFGGGRADNYSNVLDYITIASTGNAIGFGDLTQATYALAACADATRGVFGGGAINVESDRTPKIDYINIASTGNAVEFGDLTQAKYALAACADATRGVFGGGFAVAISSIIDYITIASTGNATNFGNLTQATYTLAACAGQAEILITTTTSSTTTTTEYEQILTHELDADWGNPRNGECFAFIVQWYNTTGKIGPQETYNLCCEAYTSDIFIHELNEGWTDPGEEECFIFTAQWYDEDDNEIGAPETFNVCCDFIKTGAIIIIEETKGSRTFDYTTQRIQIRGDVQAGSYKLAINLRGDKRWTGSIPWDSSPEGLKTQLIALHGFDEDDIEVVQENVSADYDIRLSYLITFSSNYAGIIEVIEADYIETLLCDPLLIYPLPPPPYEYPIEECNQNDVSCQSGPLLCRPGEGLKPIDIEPCTIGSTNISTLLKVERDLTSPRDITLRDLALSKGLQISDYEPYTRDTYGNLNWTNWSDKIVNKNSYILVHNTLNNPNGLNRTKNYLMSNKNILPSRK